MKRLRLRADRCIGCDLCVLGCSSHHTGMFSKALACLWIRSDEEHWDYSPVICRQCGKAPCVSACSTEAISRDPATGALFLDRARCDGCQLCVSACPFEAIVFNKREGIVQLCDLCGGNPACAATCPTGAIQYN